MKTTRRTLIATAALAVATIGFSGTGPAHAGKTSYSPGKFAQYKKSGKPFMLDFYASWCGTCRVQGRVINSLLKSDPALSKITVMKVDWDRYRGEPITRKLRIPRRSTLVMFKGGREVGRVVAKTSKSSIRSLMRRGL